MNPSARPGTAVGRSPPTGRPPSAAAGGRPTTAYASRPTTGAVSRSPHATHAPPMTAAPTGRPPQTAAARTRTGSAAPRQAPRTAAATARPGTRSGLTTAGGLAAHMNLSERPVTQQGLQGVRPGTTRGQRQVQDKTYFMGLLRAKMTELNSELAKLNKEIDQNSKENQNQLIYEKKAETLAQEIKLLQGQLADHNMLIDKMTMTSDNSDMLIEYQELKALNDVEAQTVDQLFAERRQKEEEMKQLEADLDHERSMADRLMNSMDNRIRGRFEELKRQHEQILEEMQLKENELQELSFKKAELEEDLGASRLKQEAMVLHERLAQLEAQHDAIALEANAQGTPDQQRERLLEKVKQDNQEIQTMERQTAEAKERVEQVHVELKELDQDFEDQQGEKNQKYKELRIKEQEMDEFLEAYEEKKTQELDAIQAMETAIVKMLTTISKNAGKYDVSGNGLSALESSSKPSSDPKEEYQRLQSELQKLEATEIKLKEEQMNLQEKFEKLVEDLRTFSNVDQLRADTIQKNRDLEEEKEILGNQVGDVKQKARALQEEVDGLRSKLNDNEMHIQVVNLEKKLQVLEQNNFVTREILEARNAESNPGPVKENVIQMVADYNQLLIQNLAKGPFGPGRGGSG